MDASEFLRVFPMRQPNLMWFLGAGASAAAGIPTAGHMILDFKRTLYCTATRTLVRSMADLNDPAVLARFRAYFTPEKGFPADGSDEEYAKLFERTYPDEKDRRRYLANLLTAAVPSFGHLALAALIKLDKVRAVWTTNFDRTIEDAIARVLGTTNRTIVAELGHPELAEQALNEGRWPLVVKLHGDFQSRELKNTTEELKAQDGRLRRSCVDACRRQGLAVIGYSGRDHSVMDALEDAIDGGNGFPSGLFWFHRPGSPPLTRVTQLLDKAKTLKVDAHLVEVETFDELLGDTFIPVKDALPPDIVELLNQRPQRTTAAKVPTPQGGMPVIRFNALPVTESPKTCRVVKCSIGGAKEVRDAVKAAGADLVVGRRGVGVLAFGSDAEIRKAFESHQITGYDVYAIEPRRLQYDDSVELGMLNDAIARALMRDRPLNGSRRRSGWELYVNRDRLDDPAFASLRAAAVPLVGTVPKTGIAWAEAIRIRLERRLDRLWLLFEPSIWMDKTEDDSAFAIGKEFVRNRIAARYNAAVNRVFDGWADVIVGSGANAELRAFGIGDGVDAVFNVLKTTAFSLRGASI